MNHFKVKIIAAASNDLTDARAWYRQQNTSLTKRFTQEVKNTIEHLATMPTAHAIRYHNIRIAQIPIFPYAVHYLIEDDTIIVIAIHHTAINPGKWPKRL